MVDTSGYVLNMMQIWSKYGENTYKRGNPTTKERNPPPNPGRWGDERWWGAVGTRVAVSGASTAVEKRTLVDKRRIKRLKVRKKWA